MLEERDRWTKSPARVHGFNLWAPGEVLLDTPNVEFHPEAAVNVFAEPRPGATKTLAEFGL
jgi:hypothetical protein